jgi:hypothetical protein
MPEGMNRILRHLLLVIALLFSQHAALLHGLAHAEHDIAAAELGGGGAPGPDHGVDVCAAFGALAHALGSFAGASCAAGTDIAAVSTPSSSLVFLTRIVFDSRAPPFPV